MQDLVTRLLYPIAPAQFLGEFYEARPLHLAGRPPAMYADVYSTKSLEQTVWRHENALLNFVRVHKAGSDMHPPRNLGRFDYFGWAMAEYENGATFIVNNLEDYEPAVASFVRPLEQFFLGRVSVSAYASPSSTSAFKPHFDTHDVVILQVEGSKSFDLHEGIGPHLPLPSQAHPIAPEELSATPDEVQLSAGDLLYLPRGLVHAARTQAAPSLHLSLGIHPLSTGKLVVSAVERAIELAACLRRTVSPNARRNPPEVVRSVLAVINQAVGTDIKLDELLDRWEEQLVASQRALPGSRIAASWVAETLTLESVVAHAEGATCLTWVDQRVAAIAFPGLAVIRDEKERPIRIELPKGAAEALEFIAYHRDGFRIGDIPDCLSGRSKIHLIKRLISEGLLVVR